MPRRTGRPLSVSTRSTQMPFLLKIPANTENSPIDLASGPTSYLVRVSHCSLTLPGAISSLKIGSGSEDRHIVDLLAGPIGSVIIFILVISSLAKSKFLRSLARSVDIEIFPSFSFRARIFSSRDCALTACVFFSGVRATVDLTFKLVSKSSFFSICHSATSLTLV